MLKSEFVYLAEYLLYSLQFGFESLGNSSGIFFIICILVPVFTAGFSYPKKYIKNFFIVTSLLFIFIILFIFLEDPNLANMLVFAFAYIPNCIAFYWLTVLGMFLLSLTGPLTSKKRKILCSVISILLWNFVFFWVTFSTALVYFIAEHF